MDQIKRLKEANRKPYCAICIKDEIAVHYHTFNANAGIYCPKCGQTTKDKWLSKNEVIDILGEHYKEYKVT